MMSSGSMKRIAKFVSSKSFVVQISVLTEMEWKMLYKVTLSWNHDFISFQWKPSQVWQLPSSCPYPKLVKTVLVKMEVPFKPQVCKFIKEYSFPSLVNKPFLGKKFEVFVTRLSSHCRCLTNLSQLIQFLKE